MKFFDKIRQNDFLKHNAVFFVGSVLVGVLNYAYYPIVGRLMSPTAFGEVQVLISLFLQFTILLNVLSMITVNIVVNSTDQGKAHRVVFELEKLMVYLAAVLLGISLIGGEFLRSALKFESSLPFTALGLAILTSIPLTFRSAFARAKKRFGIASSSQLIGTAAKIALSAGLVIVGLGVLGAVLGIVAAQLVAFLYAARWAARLGFKRPADTHYGTLPDLRAVLPELKYAGAVLVALLSVTLLMSIDVIAVKYLFDAHTAGLYAGIATVARIIFFLAVPLSQVLMPMVKIGNTTGQNARLLIKSLLLTMAVCGMVLLIMVIAPEFTIKILMGVEYITYSPLLPPLAAAIFLVSIVNLIFMYFLALRQKMVMLVGIIGFATLLGVLMVQHSSVHAVVNSMLLGSTFTLALAVTYVLVNLKRGDRHAKQNYIDRHTDL